MPCHGPQRAGRVWVTVGVVGRGGGGEDEGWTIDEAQTRRPPWTCPHATSSRRRDEPRRGIRPVAAPRRRGLPPVLPGVDEAVRLVRRPAAPAGPRRHGAHAA